MGGEIEEAKGRLKEAAGTLIGDDDLKKEGEADREEGEAMDKLSEAKEKRRESGS